MNESVRDLLRQGADTVERPRLDVSHLVAQAERRLLRRRVARVAAGAAAVAAIVTGAVALQPSGQPPSPAPPVPTHTPTTQPETVPTAPSEELAVQIGTRSLRVAGDPVPGRWELTDTRRDVWVAIKTDENDSTSQWWGKGATARPVPPSAGGILRGGVVISQDARWIVWTRPTDDISSSNPPRVMEVVDTATGEVRWRRNADADAPDLGALAVTNDGVVVFGHCLETVFDSGGWPQCEDARVDVWAPEDDAISTLPAEVTVGDAPFPDVIRALGPLVKRTGAHNGLLVQRAETARPQYVRVSARGTVEVVATLPRSAVAVTADERFALLSAECPDGLRGCGFSVLRLDGGGRLPMPSLMDLLPPATAPYYSFVVEQDDLLLVREPLNMDNSAGAAIARCSLAQARCVGIEE